MRAEELVRASLDDLGARERILKTALDQFSRNGIHRTGTDLLIAESGVAKMTFYRLFKTKAGLVAEYLKLRDEEWFSIIQKHIDSQKNPTQRALAVFDGLQEWFEQPNFSGCCFIRGLYEFTPEADDPEVLKINDEHFKKLKSTTTELIRAARPKDFAKIVPQFLTLIAGSIVLAQLTKSSDIAQINKSQARKLLI